MKIAILGGTGALLHLQFLNLKKLKKFIVYQGMLAPQKLINMFDINNFEILYKFLHENNIIFFR